MLPSRFGVEGRESKPVREGILLQVCKGNNSEGREQGRNGINRAIVNSIPNLQMNVSLGNLTLIECRTCLAAVWSTTVLSRFLKSSMVLTFLIFPSARMWLTGTLVIRLDRSIHMVTDKDLLNTGQGVA